MQIPDDTVVLTEEECYSLKKERDQYWKVVDDINRRLDYEKDRGKRQNVEKNREFVGKWFHRAPKEHETLREHYLFIYEPAVDKSTLMRRLVYPNLQAIRFVTDVDLLSPDDVIDYTEVDAFGLKNYYEEVNEVQALAAILGALEAVAKKGKNKDYF